MAKKTWNEKLQNSKDMPRVETLDDPKAIERFGGAKMLIAPPLEYEGLMQKVPQGKLVTTTQLREKLAKTNGADFTCPLTAGIFVNIVANAAQERGGDTPYWRTVKKDGELCEKFPDGLDGHKFLLEKEGHAVIQKGKRYFVENYEQKLIHLDDL